MTVEASLSRIGMPPIKSRHAEHELVAPAHHHADVRQQRIEVGAGDVAEILEQHRAGAQLRLLRRFLLALPAVCGSRHGFLHRDQHHHVVVDLERGLPVCGIQPALFITTVSWWWPRRKNRMS